jgi:hypothetical protein
MNVPSMEEPLLSNDEKKLKSFVTIIKAGREVYKNQQQVIDLFGNVLVISIVSVLCLPWEFWFEKQEKDDDVLQTKFVKWFVQTALAGTIVYIVTSYLGNVQTKREMLNNLLNEVKKANAEIEQQKAANDEENGQAWQEACTKKIEMIEKKWKKLFGKKSDIHQNEIEKWNWRCCPFYCTERVCSCCDRRRTSKAPVQPSDPSTFLQLKFAAETQAQYFDKQSQKYKRCLLLFCFLMLVVSVGNYLVASLLFRETNGISLAIASLGPVVSFSYIIYYAYWRWDLFSGMKRKNEDEVIKKLKENEQDDCQQLHQEIQELYDECNEKWSKLHGALSEMLLKAMKQG